MAHQQSFTNEVLDGSTDAASEIIYGSSVEFLAWALLVVQDFKIKGVWTSFMGLIRSLMLGLDGQVMSWVHVTFLDLGITDAGEIGLCWPNIQNSCPELVKVVILELSKFFASWHRCPLFIGFESFVLRFLEVSLLLKGQA
ncbi:hypothetical protein PIB30_044254 [Stylosanthes scabra]|uniref:Uncharacterized protein n=1 Tax=Stylosanthes scabra TaxID=79078 RepID=A0ABU6ZEJ0_9FABA|nr:hypothetical protein [Stylosanthes scabra]